MEGELGPRMRFRGKEVLNWSLNKIVALKLISLLRKMCFRNFKRYIGLFISSYLDKNILSWKDHCISL